jgi:thioredoxin 1
MRTLIGMTDSSFAVFDAANFDAEVTSRRGLVLVDFWSDGCVPCKQLGRVLGQLAEELPADVRIGTVNAGANPSLAERYGVRGTPTLLFIKDGAVVETRTGVDRRQVLKKLVETHA